MNNEIFCAYDNYTGWKYAGPFYSRRLAEQAATKFPKSSVGTEQDVEKAWRDRLDTKANPVSHWNTRAGDLQRELVGSLEEALKDIERLIIREG